MNPENELGITSQEMVTVRAAQIITIHDESFLPDMMVVRGSYGLSARERSQTEDRLARDLRNREERQVYLCLEEGDHPAGYVQLIWKNADSDPDLANGKDTAHIHDLRVRADLQGQHMGRRLMEHLENEARRLNIHVLTLGVESSNGRALRFYDHLGFRKFKQQPGRSENETVFFMFKEI